MNAQIEFKITPKDKFSFDYKEIWQYRELFYFFIWRDVKVKYKQTALGITWVILQPVLLMSIFTIIFNKGLKIQPTTELPYPVFAFSGLLVWQFFSSGLSNAANSMLANANIIKKIYFPRLIIPLSSILTSSIDFLFTLLVFLGILLFYHISFNPFLWLLFLILSMALTFLTCSGLSLFLAAWNVKYRDFQYVIPFLVQVLFFISPILYNSDQCIGGFLGVLLKLNPMSGAIHLSRAAFLSQPIDLELIACSSISALVWFVFGLFSFRKMEAYFADLA